MIENNAISGQFIGKSEKEIMEMLHAQSNCENDKEGCKIVGTIVIGTIIAPVAITLLPEEALIGGAINGTANLVCQHFFGEEDKTDWTDVGISTLVGTITGGLGTGLWGTIGWNATGGALSNQLNGKDPLIGALLGGGSSALGYGTGKLGEKMFNSWLNPVASKYIHETNKGYLGITGHFTESSIPTWSGNIFNSGSSKFYEEMTKKTLKEVNNEKK